MHIFSIKFYEAHTADKKCYSKSAIRSR